MLFVISFALAPMVAIIVTFAYRLQIDYVKRFGVNFISQRLLRAFIGELIFADTICSLPFQYCQFVLNHCFQIHQTALRLVCHEPRGY